MNQTVKVPSAKQLLKIVTFGKGKHLYKLNALLANGNTKLPRTTATFNITPAKLCPSLALGWSVCGGNCKVCEKCSINGHNIVIKRH